jgi:hypothetical protein
VLWQARKNLACAPAKVQTYHKMHPNPVVVANAKARKFIITFLAKQAFYK